MEKTRSRGVRRSEQQWIEILRRFEASGQGSREFCHSNGLPLSSLQRWHRRMRLGPAAKFVELVPPAAGPVAATSWSLEVLLPGGASLRFQG